MTSVAADEADSRKATNWKAAQYAGRTLALTGVAFSRIWTEKNEKKNF